MSEWQPIETAPKDGTLVIVYQPNGAWRQHAIRGGERIVTAYWHQPGNPAAEGCWVASSGHSYRPTHWQPLPDPPKAQP